MTHPQRFSSFVCQTPESLAVSALRMNGFMGISFLNRFAKIALAAHFALPGTSLLTASAEPHPYTSPDGSLAITVIPARKKKGFEDVESRMEGREQENLVLSKGLSSADREHGARI